MFPLMGSAFPVFPTMAAMSLMPAPMVQPVVAPFQGAWGALGQLMQQGTQRLGQQFFPSPPTLQQLSTTGNSSFSVPTEYQPIFAAAAQRHNVPQNLLEAVAHTESRFRPDARSPAGAQGIMQLMPATAQGLGVANPMDPAQNIEGGARYLAQMLRLFNGDQRLALAAYNAGPGRVRRYGGVPPIRETQNYVQTIMGRLGQ